MNWGSELGFGAINSFLGEFLIIRVGAQALACDGRVVVTD